MYILLQKPGAMDADATVNQVMLHIPMGTIRGVYNEDGSAVPAAAAAADGSIYNPGANLKDYKNKLVHEISIPDVLPAAAAADPVQVGELTVKVKAPTVSEPVTDSTSGSTSGGKKRRYHGKTKKSRR
jgi:hypothetical protein